MHVHATHEQSKDFRLTGRAKVAGSGAEISNPMVQLLALLPTFLLEAPLEKRALKVFDIGVEAEGATIYIAYPEHLKSSGKFAR
jgi:hypothetical protein